MPKDAKPLTQRRLDLLKPKLGKAGKPIRTAVHDGDGLMVVIHPTGDKAWIVRVRVDGRRREMGLGSYPLVGLAQAREMARAATLAAKSGRDPIIDRTEAKASASAQREEAAERTFAKVAEAYIGRREGEFKHARTADLWRGSLEKWAYPTLGNMGVAEIDRHTVFRAMEYGRKEKECLWTDHPATARKVLRRIGAILRHAASKGWRLNDNPADSKMLREMGLPEPPAGRKQPSLPWQRVPDFMKALASVPGASALALRFTILTAVRSGEARGARWDEVAWDEVPTWTVPAERMKGKKTAEARAHRVPLSSAAIEVLRLAAEYALPGETVLRDGLAETAKQLGSAFIFPSTKEDTALSDMALSEVVRGMNAAATKGMVDGTVPPWVDPSTRPARPVVPHGFRSSFSTWADDTCPEEREAAERALAHEVGGVSGIYRRSDLFARRVPLMEAWAKHCVPRPKLKVVA